MNNDFQQIKTGKENYEIITDDTINRIPKIQAFQDAELNNMMYEFHKKLLRIAKKHKDKEVGLFWDLDHIEKEPIIVIGERDGIDIRKNEAVNYMVRNTQRHSHVVVMHNHPRNGLFSSKDIESFINFNPVYIMTAVCNDGTIHMLRKENNFNPFLMKTYYDEGANRSSKETKKEKLEKIKRYKLDENNPKDKEKIIKMQTKPYYYGAKNVAKHAREIGVTYRCSVKRKEN